MRRFVSVVAIAAVFAACGGKEADTASIQKNLEKKGTLDLLKETADDKYDAPANGRLTEAQVQMYLKVREHEKKIAAVAKADARQHADKAKEAGEKSLAGMMEGLKAVGSVADLATADIRAAKELGYNTQEYLWVKGQILAASTAAIAEKSTQAISAAVDTGYEQAKKAYETATDETTKKMYKEMLDGYEKQKQEMVKNAPTVDDALAFNRQLLAKYENVMNAFAAEASKWNDKPGDAEKSVADFEKAADKTIEEAKKSKP